MTNTIYHRHPKRHDFKNERKHPVHENNQSILQLLHPPPMMTTTTTTTTTTKTMPPPSHSNENIYYSNNIMFDSRVVRGNTFASPVITADQRLQWDILERHRRNRRKRKNKKHSKQLLEPLETSFSMPSHLSNTNAIGRSRSNIETQTNHDWEELPNEIDCHVQTDPCHIEFSHYSTLYQDLNSVLYKSASTQVEENELFDFDIEVQPILQDLIRKCLDAVKVELSQEEELNALTKRKQKFEKQRQTQMEQIQIMERDIQIYKEQHCQLQQELKHRQEQEYNEVELLAANVLNDAKHKVFDDLNKSGYFCDDVKTEVCYLFS